MKLFDFSKKNAEKNAEKEAKVKENKVEECTNIFYIIELTSIKTYNLEQQDLEE